MDYDMTAPIPRHLRVRGADIQLYRIGLSLFSPQHYYYKRRLFYNPLLVFIILITNFMKSMVFIYAHFRNIKLSPFIHIYLGSLDYFMGTGCITSILLVSFDIFAISSQLVSYHNYKHGIIPTDLRVFKMVAGLISPKSIGITDRLLISKICDICRKSLIVGKIAIPLFGPILAFSYSFNSYVMSGNYYYIIVVGIPLSIYFSIWARHIINITVYQTVYYFILTYYLKSKIKSINNVIKSRLINISHTRNYFYIKGLIHDLNAIYCEISEYNRNYWSKFLASVWLTFSLLICYFAH